MINKNLYEVRKLAYHVNEGTQPRFYLKCLQAQRQVVNISEDKKFIKIGERGEVKHRKVSIDR